MPRPHRPPRVLSFGFPGGDSFKLCFPGPKLPMGSFLGRAAESDPWKACQGPTELFGLRNVHRIGRARDMWSTYGVNTTETMAKNKHSCCGWRLENETSQRGGLSTHVFFLSFVVVFLPAISFVVCAARIPVPGFSRFLHRLAFVSGPIRLRKARGVGCEGDALPDLASLRPVSALLRAQLLPHKVVAKVSRAVPLAKKIQGKSKCPHFAQGTPTSEMTNTLAVQRLGDLTCSTAVQLKKLCG